MNTRNRYTLRGGSWNDIELRNARAAYRNGFDVTYRNDDLGFRCALTVC